MEKWKKVWFSDDGHTYGDVFYKRSIGNLPVMESAHAVVNKLRFCMRSGIRIVDIGCGAGHYLKPLIDAFGNSFNYTGVDATPHYINQAKRAFKNYKNVAFLVADIYELPFNDAAFDIVICNNVLLHLPSIERPIHELMRIAKEKTLIRSLIGERSFRIQDININNEEYNHAGEPMNFSYFNIYSESYIREVIQKQGKTCGILISADHNYNPDNIVQSTHELGEIYNVTKVQKGVQMNAYIAQPWAFVELDYSFVT